MEGLNHNRTRVYYTEFVLFGFPGIIRNRQFLLFPFLFIYITILAGNILIIHQIFIEPKLHSPMYFLISLLFAANISCTTSVLPKFLLGLSFNMNQIPLVGCLIQMFFIYFWGAFESGVILMMALDRFVAICKPLRYNNIMTKHFLIQLVLLGIAQGMFLIIPVVVLTSRVRFCRSKIILNFVCENMGLLSLACDDISKLHVVGLMTKIFGTLLDFGLLLVSYSYILHRTMKIIVGKARHKALHTCVTHLAVAMLIYICSLITSIVYRMHTHISYDVKNLFNAIYLMLPAFANPFIYGLGVKEIRQCLLKTWKTKNTSHFS
ncbi:olfactory receptor 52K1-like [Aquarana catesbeiana]|uniref:olfactory receptor 52K1-like n=1 Tax=Aquarana catesbeiana TaxID=8400 RepID=UPI003CC9A0ED